MKRYTEEFRAEVLEVYVKQGPSAAARQYGIPSGTVKSWAHDAGISTEVVHKASIEAAHEALRRKRAEVRVKLLHRVDELLDRLEQERDPKAYRDWAWSFGVLFDKVRLEEGQATERTESLSLDRIDSEILRLEGELAARDGGA